MRALLLAATLSVALSGTATADVVALKAGTIHTVDGAGTIENGTVLIRDGKIVAVGTDLQVPLDARVVDYGPGAVIAPGLVAANSGYGSRTASQRTVDPAVRAIDNFDPFSSWLVRDLYGGVTTMYVAPARGRLIAGQGAVVKLVRGDSPTVLSESAAIHGSIGTEARRTPGYWEPPVPATVDVGLGVVQPQLPRTTMGAVVALEELVGAAKTGTVAEDFGPDAARELEALMDAGKTWRLGANTAIEIRALLAFAKKHGIQLVIDGGAAAGELADELAAAGVPVVVEVDFRPESPGRDFGKRTDSVWPSYDNAVKLARAGAPFAISTPDRVWSSDLRFIAALASRGGLSEADALRAITLSAAEVLGVDDRVGSLAPGKDGDVAVFSGSPLAAGSTVLATWIDGEAAFDAEDAFDRAADYAVERSGARRPARATVIEVDELHVGDGTVISPGEVLLQGRRIAAVGRTVSRPPGARVVHAAAAMPGIIDAQGYLGLEGSNKSANPDFPMRRIVEPGDFTDRRVARAGVTTVVIAPRAQTKKGAPMMAYKPAAADVDAAVVADLAALRFVWPDDKNANRSGEDVRDVLEKLAKYVEKWEEYEKEMKSWTPPPPKEDAKKDEDDEKKDGDKDDEKDEDEGDEKKDDDKDSKSKKKKGKKGKEPEEADPVSGIWETEVVVPPYAEPERLRLRMELSGSEVRGSLRCDAVSDTLVQLSGTWLDKQVSLQGYGSRGRVHVTGEAKGGEFEGRLHVGSADVELEAERKTKDLPVARRSEPKKEEVEKEREPKGKPREPGIDEDLEPLRRAMRGKAAVVVRADRARDIVECVEAFAPFGIRPVILGGSGAAGVASQIRGRVAGVILDQRVLSRSSSRGVTSVTNRYAALAAAGIPVAFQSSAEEGAADLPLMASYAIAHGLSPAEAMAALTSNTAKMYAIDKRVGTLEYGKDADVLLLDGPPLDPRTRVLRTWVNGEEIR